MGPLRHRPERRGGTAISNTSKPASGTDRRRLPGGGSRGSALRFRRPAARGAGGAAARQALAAARAEADAISGVLGDELLAAVVSRVAPDLPGPLGRSPLALTRGVMTFCRAAYATRPDDLGDAVSAA